MREVGVMRVTTVNALLISLMIAMLGLALRAEAGGRVYTANMESGTISVIDPDSMKVVATIDPRGHRTHDLVLSPDQSKLFAMNMHDGTLAVVDIASGETIATIPTGKMAHSAAATPDGKQVWVVNAAEEFLTVVDVSLLKVVGRVPLGQIIGAGYIRFSPDGMRAFVTRPTIGAVSVIDVASRRVVATVEVGKRPTFIQVTSDGRRIWGTDTGGDEIYALDVTNDTLLGKLTVGRGPNHLAIVGNTLYVTLGVTNEVAVVGDADGQVSVRARIKVGGRPSGIWPSPDGKRLYVTGEGTNDLHVIDIGLEKVVGTVPVGRRPVAVVTAR
jgi:YVTN family beta-propeller protein